MIYAVGLIDVRTAKVFSVGIYSSNALGLTRMATAQPVDLSPPMPAARTYEAARDKLTAWLKDYEPWVYAALQNKGKPVVDE